MSDSIFRKEALDQMANPERLDQPVRLVAPSGWIVLGAFGLLVAAALVWAALAAAPVRIMGEGMLIDRAGLSEVTAAIDGQIAQVLVRPGQTVNRGDEIALLGKSDLNRQITETSAKLDAARARLASLSTFYLDENGKVGTAANDRLAGIAHSRAELVRRQSLLAERAARIASLVPRGFVRREEAINAEVVVAEVKERIGDLDALSEQVRIEALKSSGENHIALIDATNSAQDLERERARLVAQLAEQTAVRASDHGRVVELQVAPGDVVAPGSRVATIARSGNGSQLIAIAYVPAGAGKRIRSGMDARVAPRTVERAAFGEIAGKVLTVSALPESRDGMRQVLRNDQLVDQLLAGGAVVEVRIALTPDAAAPSGYAWTSSRGPDARIEAGTLADSAITVERKSIISWLLPGR